MFVGKRLRTREDISHEMYKDELEVSNLCKLLLLRIVFWLAVRPL